VRLFVAIVPPPAVTAELDACTAPLRPAWPGLRWTGPEAWHVTLTFLGEVREEVLPELTTRLERAARRHRAQRLAVRGGGAFPSSPRARVVWAGLDADRPALAALAASVAAGARRAGAPSPGEDRRFRAHITLARLREPGDVRPLTAELSGLSGTPWTAAEIQLIRSHLPGPGAGRTPVYTSLAAWPLTTP
jgi:RNA 2',3'-cyclic 3'-phosphodiesterase